MSNFLEQMAEASRSRVRSAAASEPLVALRRRAADRPAPPAFVVENAFELIAEFKRSSPALGKLAADGEPLAARVTAYARGGAAAVSVLTEPARFDGSLEDLEEAAAALAPLRIPVMRKDFLVDPHQLYESRAAGAGGVLLIARILPAGLLAEMLACARELSLFALIEAFDAADVERITTALKAAGGPRNAGPVLVGVNSRDLATLEVSPGRFRELAPLLPAGPPRVAESGISTPEECAGVARAGYAAALVGGSLMRERDPVSAVRAMLDAGRMAARSAA